MACCAIILLIVGIFVLLGAFAGLDNGSGHPVLIVAVLTIGGSILWLRSLKPTYHIAISSASGEANALSSKDQAYIERVVKSINDAIVKYQ
jgi:pyruvate carboxylase